MDTFEMIEMLRERADITYEEGKEVLDLANGSLLEATVLLEKQGKLRKPQAEENHTSSETETAGEAKAAAGAADPADDTVRAGTGSTGKGSSGLGKAFHTAGNFLTHTAFHVTHSGKELLMLPSWSFAVLMLIFWETIIPVMLISLFFNVRYFFDGTEETQAANEVLYKAGSFASGFEEGLNNDNGSGQTS